MIQIIWEFNVKPEHIAQFEQYYHAEGDWAQLFRKAKDYQGTTLLRDATTPSRYLTIDRWQTQAAFAQFKQQFGSLYDSMDKACEGWTLSEKKLGMFEDY